MSMRRRGGKPFASGTSGNGSSSKGKSVAADPAVEPLSRRVADISVQWTKDDGKREVNSWKSNSRAVGLAAKRWVRCGEARGGQKEVKDEEKDYEIVWPPMVMIMNTRLEADENNKWIVMRKQELLECFDSYHPVKAWHSYGSHGHRGIVKEDLDMFNQHSRGKSKLKYELRSHHKMVTSQITQIDEDNQQLGWHKDKFFEKDRRVKAPEETLDVSQKSMEENHILRIGSKMQREENKEEEVRELSNSTNRLMDEKSHGGQEQEPIGERSSVQLLKDIVYCISNRRNDDVNTVGDDFFKTVDSQRDDLSKFRELVSSCKQVVDVSIAMVES